MAKTKTDQMCRSQGIDGLKQSHGSSLEPLNKHFESHGWVFETRKYPNWKKKNICHDFNQLSSMDRSMEMETFQDNKEQVANPMTKT